MSRTTICVAGADGVMQKGRDFRNSYGSAWFVWDALWRGHLGAEGSLFDLDTQERVWGLVEDTRLTVAERVTLAATFDYCLVRRQEAAVVAAAFDEFVRIYERRRDGRACTLPLQAMYLRELAVCPEIYEIGWQQTSTAADLWWFVREMTSSHGETKLLNDEPYDLNKGDKHWHLFERYPELWAPAPV